MSLVATRHKKKTSRHFHIAIDFWREQKFFEKIIGKELSRYIWRELEL
jgi:hypothetical protein